MGFLFFEQLPIRALLIVGTQHRAHRRWRLEPPDARDNFGLLESPVGKYQTACDEWDAKKFEPRPFFVRQVESAW